MAAATRKEAGRLKEPATPPKLDPDLLRDVAGSFTALLHAIQELSSPNRGQNDNAAEPATTWQGSIETACAEFEQKLQSALRLPFVESAFSRPWPAEARLVLPSRESETQQGPAIWATVLAWAAMHSLGHAKDPANPEHAAARFIDEFRLREPMAEAFESYGLTGEKRWQAAARVRAALAHRSWGPGAEHGRQETAPFSWMNDPEVAWLLGVNEHEGIRYFLKEPFEELLWWLSLPTLLRLAGQTAIDTKAVAELEKELSSRIGCAAEAGYRVDGLFEVERTESAAQPFSSKDAKNVDSSAEQDREPDPKHEAAAPKSRSRK